MSVFDMRLKYCTCQICDKTCASSLKLKEATRILKLNMEFKNVQYIWKPFFLRLLYESSKKKAPIETLLKNRLFEKWSLYVLRIATC